MSDFDKGDTNVGMGMAPHRKGCRCSDCHIEKLERELAAANEKGENLHAKFRETEAALIAARRELAEARDGALEEAAKVRCKRCLEGSPVTYHAGYWRHMQDSRLHGTVMICDGWITCYANDIRTLKSPAQGATINAAGQDAMAGARVDSVAVPIPAPAAPNTAPQDRMGELPRNALGNLSASNASSDDLPAAAVPDDPVAVYSRLIGSDGTYIRGGDKDAIRALANHYEARGMRKAAELVKYRGQCAVAMINAEERIEEKKSYAWDALQHGIAVETAAAELERKP